MVDFSAIAKWPNVPACYEWLSLDRRGDWRLQGERVTHRGLIEFMNRQYACDEGGRWFVQNGPQRVFVDLACTPWVYRREGEHFLTHTGEASGPLSAIYLDRDGNLLIAAERGIGLLDDRDLANLLGECLGSDAKPAGESQFESLLTGQATGVYWRDLAIQPLDAGDLESRFGFVARPRP